MNTVSLAEQLHMFCTFYNNAWLYCVLVYVMIDRGVSLYNKYHRHL